MAIGSREFSHTLPKRYAEEVGLQWPEAYPKTAGGRGGPKDKRPKEE